MATAAAAVALSMKLLVDRKAQRVLFAEASKDVVDFLFSLLALPVATAVELLGNEAMVGCVANLFASVDKLDSTYVQPGAAKDALLRPTVAVPPAATTNSSLLCLPAAAAPSSGQLHTLYWCTGTSKIQSRKKYPRKLHGEVTSKCSTYVTNAYGETCPACRRPMTTPAQYLSSPGSVDASGQEAQSGDQGFVQGIVTYTVLDDLTVAPMSSAISGITLLLDTFGVKELGDLQEKTVQLGYEEGLAILRASLQSKTVLTDVFLAGNQNAPPGGRVYI